MSVILRGYMPGWLAAGRGHSQLRQLAATGPPGAARQAAGESQAPGLGARSAASTPEPGRAGPQGCLRGVGGRLGPVHGGGARGCGAGQAGSATPGIKVFAVSHRRGSPCQAAVGEGLAGALHLSAAVCCVPEMARICCWVHVPNHVQLETLRRMKLSC